MTGLVPNRSVPEATVIPVPAYPDVVEATDWLCRTFGFTVRLRIADHRAQLVFGDGAVIVTNGGSGDAAVHSVLVRIEDADTRHDQGAGRRQQALFADSSPADFDEAAARLLKDRTIAFLDSVS